MHDLEKVLKSLPLEKSKLIVTDGVFLEPRNFSNLMRQTAVTGVLAVGMVMVILAGQIDLSVGSLVGITGMAAVLVQTSLHWGLLPSLLAGIAVGGAIGALQGVLTAYAGIPAFFITGIANLGNPGTGSPFQFRDNQYLTAINVSKTKGAHNIRAGFEYDKFALNHFQPQGGVFQTPRGSFRFDGTLTALKGGATSTNANSWAQFMLGFPSETGKATQLFNPNALRFAT